MAPKESSKPKENKPKSFFEEILAKEVEKDPNAVQELSELKEAPEKVKAPKAKEAKPAEKSLFE